MVQYTVVELAARQVDTDNGPVSYDYLILAVGGETNYFGMDSILRHGFGLKGVVDAVAIRNHVLRCFERAMLEPDAERRRALLTFVVVGGGPTGVEMAGALSELIRLVLVKDYPRLNIKDVRVLLLEATDRLLAAMPERLRDEPALAFRYKDPGSLATIGRNAAVAYIGGVAFKGFAAWVVWLVVHILQLIGFRNKLFVLMNWAWDYFFYERAARLITK